MRPVLVSELASFLPACPHRPSGTPSPCLLAGQQRGREAGGERATPARSLSCAPQCSPAQGPAAFQGPGGAWVPAGPSQALSGGKLVREQGACTEPGASSPSGPKLRRGPGVREHGAQLGCVTSLQNAWAEGKLPAGRNRLLLSLLLPDFTPRGRQELVFSWVPPRGL